MSIPVPAPKITEIQLTNNKAKNLLRIDNLDELVDYFNTNVVISKENCRIIFDRNLLVALIGSRLLDTNIYFKTHNDYLIKGTIYWMRLDSLIIYIHINIQKLESELLLKNKQLLEFIYNYANKSIDKSK